MKATIQDVAVLQALKPLDIVSYLRAGHWTKQLEKPNSSSVWTMASVGGDEFEVAVPLNMKFRDYPSRISDILRTLEVVEERSQLDILRDLLVISADVIRVKLADADLSDGSVPLEEGASFFQKAKDMMLAAACSAAEPRAYYPSRKPSQAMDYIRRARLGQTEHGSFVLTLISRVPPSLAGGNGKLFEAEEPFERRVTQTLASSLMSLKNASADAASTGNVKSFTNGIAKGISANLCDAIVGMGTCADNNRALEVRFTWSRTRPLDLNLGIPSEIAFTPDSFPVITEASHLLKESAPREEFEVYGPVFQLEQTPGASTGKVKVICFIDGQPRKVAVELEASDYHRAVEAHDQGRPVRASGMLIREGRSFRLKDARDFVVDSEDA